MLECVAQAMCSRALCRTPATSSSTATSASRTAAIMPAIQQQHDRQQRDQAAPGTKMQTQKQKQKQKQLTDSLKLVQQAVKAANEEADLMRHLPAFAAFAKPGLSAAVASCAASQLSEVQREALWALFEANMQAVYSADGQPWNPRAKRRELFHEDARYLLVTDSGSGQLLAYSHFRFEVEENLLAAEEMAALQLARYEPVVYCYELQLAQPVHRKGLGRRLMQMLELLALRFGMHHVLLTVQKSNAAALSFYGRIGYAQHPSCPERNGFDDFDGADPGHRIMFKDLRRK